AERLAEVVEVAIEVDAVGEDESAGGAASAVQAVHQRALAGPARAQQADELARLDDQIDVVEEFAGAAAGELDDFFETARFEAQADAVVDGLQRLADQREKE